jgi:hypothetical protein
VEWNFGKGAGMGGGMLDGEEIFLALWWHIVDQSYAREHFQRFLSWWRDAFCHAGTFWTDLMLDSILGDLCYGEEIFLALCQHIVGQFYAREHFRRSLLWWRERLCDETERGPIRRPDYYLMIGLVQDISRHVWEKFSSYSGVCHVLGVVEDRWSSCLGEIQRLFGDLLCAGRRSRPVVVMPGRNSEVIREFVMCWTW